MSMNLLDAKTLFLKKAIDHLKVFAEAQARVSTAHAVALQN